MSEETKSKKKWPTTKDFVYLQIFSVSLIVFLLVNGIPNPEVLSDKLALGAALFSILLAGVAIIIPFVQSNETSRQSFQMLSEVSKLTSEFSKLTSDIATLKAIRADVSQDIEGVISKVLETPQPEQAPKTTEDLQKQNEELMQTLNELKMLANQMNKTNESIPMKHSEVLGSITVSHAKSSDSGRWIVHDKHGNIKNKDF